MSPETALCGIWACWQVRGRTQFLTYFSADVEYALYIPQDTVPFGGVTVGKAAFSDRLQTILDQFEILNYEAVFLGATEDTARGIVRFNYRHRATGECIDGMMRHVIKLQDGLIVRIEEYHDVDRVRAFMRLVAHTAATNPLLVDQPADET